MNQPANIALLAIAAIVAVVAQQAFVSPAVVEKAPASTPKKTPALAALEGEVLSVDPISSDGEANSLARKARVKLRSGEIVQASVGGCVVFPGQTTRLLKRWSGSDSYYVVAANGKNDS